MRAGKLTCVVVAACLAACSPAPDKKPSPAVSAENHPFFPITAGAVHELGATTIDGVVACESCHPPAAETFKDLACTDCHQEPITNRLHLAATGYAWSSAACYSCHPSSDKMAFDHAGISDGCAMCHDVDTRYAALPLAGFTHPETGGTDCAACHVTTTWKGATGAPPQPTHDPRRDVLLTGYLPLWAGTSITSLDPQPQALAMEMNHGSPTLPTAAMGACSVCHVGAAAGAFYPGELHSSLANLTVAQPATCSSCHGGLSHLP